MRKTLSERSKLTNEHSSRHRRFQTVGSKPFVPADRQLQLNLPPTTTSPPFPSIDFDHPRRRSLGGLARRTIGAASRARRPHAPPTRTLTKWESIKSRLSMGFRRTRSLSSVRINQYHSIHHPHQPHRQHSIAKTTQASHPSSSSPLLRCHPSLVAVVAPAHHHSDPFPQTHSSDHCSHYHS